MPEMPKANATYLDWRAYWDQSIREQAQKRIARESQDPAYLFEQNPDVFVSQGCAKGADTSMVTAEEPRGDCPEVPLFFSEAAAE